MNTLLKHELRKVWIYLAVGIGIVGIPSAIIWLLGKYAVILGAAIFGILVCTGIGAFVYDEIIEPIMNERKSNRLKSQEKKFFERPNTPEEWREITIKKEIEKAWPGVFEKTALQQIYKEIKDMTYEEQKELLDRLADNYKKGKKT